MSGPCLSSSVADRPLRPATRLRLGGPLPRQLADRPQAPPKTPSQALVQLTCVNRPHQVLIRVSPSYPCLWGRLLTCYLSHPRIATLLFSLDLHVLTTPPAFTLSQNQTLRIKYLISYPKRLIPSLSVSLLRFLDSFFSLLNLRSAYALADICGGSHNRT